MLSIMNRTQFKRSNKDRKRSVDKVSDDLITMMRSLHVDESNIQDELMKALQNNDIVKVLNLVQLKKQLPINKKGFETLGRHGDVSTFSILNSHPSFEGNLFCKENFDGMFEGMIESDNCKLMHHLTYTHHMRSIDVAKVNHYTNLCIEQRAYGCLTILIGYVAAKNDDDTKSALKYILGRAIESSDNRIISIVLGGVRQSQPAPMLIDIK